MDVRHVDPAEAARELAGFERTDPRGIGQAEDIEQACRAGLCVRASQPDGSVLLVVQRCGETLWVDAAKGEGAGCMTTAADNVLKATGARRIAFQTLRRGLVRKAEARGFRVVGWIMERTTQ